MRKQLFVLFFVLIQIHATAQKGIFKRGTISPSVYKEQLSYNIVDKFIYVTVEIKGKEYVFMVDTGAPSTIRKGVDVEAVFAESQPIMDAVRNIQQVEYVAVSAVKIGNLTFENFVFMREDLSVFDDLGIDGIIGGNITAKSVWDFDLYHNTITISSHLDQQLKSASNFSRLKIKKTDVGTPMVTLTYFDKIKEKGIFFDTGYNGLFYLSSRMFEKVKPYVPSYITGEGVLSMNAFGSSSGETALLPLTMKMGKQSIPTFLADVDDDEESNLGVEWLSYYRVILQGNALYFSPYAQRKFETKFSGKGIKTEIENGELVVVFVWHNSPAHQYGIQVGDKIQAVNGQVVDQLPLLKQKELKKEILTSPEITLEIHRLNKTIVLKDEVLLTWE
ncbi:PDZ domain-containing protein [Myroides odoratus]|uniref:PDZ domain-containing protein n=1 Tax=Myroides odoratus TaxID=256 RepID=UPI003341115E